MSASASKRKRKELEDQGLSAKNVVVKREKEVRKKTTRNVLVFFLTAVICIAAIVAVIKLVNRPSFDSGAAVVTVGEEKVSVPVYNYFYSMTANNFHSYYSQYIQPGVSVSKQPNLFGNGSMEDYLIEQTNTNLQEVLNVVAEAKKNGYSITEEDKAQIESNVKALETDAERNNYSTERYIRSRFGEGCNLDNYREYLELMAIFSGYAQKLTEEFKPTANDLAAEYQKDPTAYDLVSFTYASVSAESTKIENDKGLTPVSATDPTASTEPTTTPTTYTDEAKAAAKEKAEGYAKEMPEDAQTVTYSMSYVSSLFTEEIATWLFDEARKEGDVKVFARNEAGTYYYTIRFDNRDTNDYCLVDASFVTITKDKENTKIEEGQKTASEKHDALLAAIRDGMTNEEFQKAVGDLGLTVNNSTITRTYSIKEIREFLYDSSRKAGDLLTSYEDDTTYYVVRYVSTAEETYRDQLVKSTLWEEYYSKLTSANKLTTDADLMQYASTDLAFSSSSSGS
jgi:hypothetical protein